MTKTEKIGVFFSTTALLISIISPIATYQWLDPNLKTFNNRGRLQVLSKLSSMNIEPVDVLSEKAEDPIPLPRFSTYFISLELRVTNIGKLPAKDIQLVIQYQNDLPSGDFFTIDPPSQYDTRNEGHQSFITLKRPLPTQESLKIIFTKISPALLSISTEYGETNIITVPFELFDTTSSKPKERKESTSHKTLQRKH